MKIYLVILLFITIGTPTISLASYNDVTLTTDTIITVGGVNLTISGSSAVVESVVVGSSSFDITLLAGSSFAVSSADKKGFTVSTSGSSVTSTIVCGASTSTLTLVPSGTATVTVTLDASCVASSVATTSTPTPPGSISPIYFPPQTGLVATSSSAPATSSSGLTTIQIQSILSLLTAFGADVITIANVQAILSTSTAATPHLFLFTRNLSLNQMSDDVKILQQFLNRHGFTVATQGAGSLGHETTTFGVRTYAALIKFQKSQGLPATGWFGPMTRGKIKAF